MSTPRGRHTVLIGDDQPMIRDIVREVLEAEPDLAVVAMAGDADEAIRLAERHRPAVAILDVRMPRGGGAHAAREIRRCSPLTRVMAFSAYGDSAVVEEMRLAGAAEYLVKGVPNVAIVAAVRRLAALG
ncbi:response regulator transcription factor [Sphaerisporangium sp. TRM90804]|uniref:response regulator n=1 Tax=Sphaerisporangium sp. TRM90804 TaxID=3031113 RepID=UPI00244C8200|nr:response regulator transcription factor [Sphaerisporangium sp. TRM90804]MDH2424427.1 response regulator transcription factor [Sphaerisporangium sp. TRM90804]